MKYLMTVLLALCLVSASGYETLLGFPTDRSWVKKDVDRSLVFVQGYDVEIGIVAANTGSKDNLLAGVNCANWKMMFENIAPFSRPCLNASFGRVEAGQRLGLKIQSPGGTGFYENCTNPALNGHTTGNLYAPWYLEKGYTKFVLVSIPDQPDYMLAICEDYLVTYPGAFTWDLVWTANWDDHVILIKAGAANVKASLDNQGFAPALVVDSAVDKLITPMLPAVAINPVPDTFVPYSSAINTSVTVTGNPTSYAADALPQATTYKMTSIESVPTGTVPSGKYVSTLKVWNRRSSAQRQANIRVNYPPVANAGAAVSCKVGMVSLDASASTDLDTDQTLSFKWTQIEGPVTTITNPNQKIAACNLNKAGRYKFRVEANDGMNCSTADKIVDVTAPLANLLVTHVEIRGTVDAAAKVEIAVNGNVASKSQNVWWYRFPVTGDGQYICNVEARENGTTNVLESKLVTVIVGDVYGQQQDVNLEKGKGQKPPVAPSDF